MKKLAVIFMLMASQAYAVEYKQVQADQSSIAFEYKQMGVAMDGKFKKFSSQLSFDPEQVAKAKASFDVELAALTPDLPKPMKKSPASRGSTPNCFLLRVLCPAASSHSVATAMKSPAS